MIDMVLMKNRPLKLAVLCLAIVIGCHGLCLCSGKPAPALKDLSDFSLTQFPIKPSGGARSFFAPGKTGRKVLFIAGAALVLGMVIKNDQRFFGRTIAYKNRNNWVSKFSPAITLLGDRGVNLGIIGGFYLGGMLFKDDKAKHTAALALRSFLFANLITETVKQFTGRQRPGAAEGIDNWSGPGVLFKKDYNSFPSAHTVTAWSVATVIAHQYDRTPVVPVISYSLAALVGLSRVTEKRHWYSDVLVGAALGYIVGKWVIRKDRKRLFVNPYFQRDAFGLKVSYIPR